MAAAGGGFHNYGAGGALWKIQAGEGVQEWGWGLCSLPDADLQISGGGTSITRPPLFSQAVYTGFSNEKPGRARRFSSFSGGGRGGGRQIPRGKSGRAL